MNDRSGSADGDATPVEPASDNRNQLELFGELVKIEHRRLDEREKQAELMRYALDISDRQDQRQAEFATGQLEASERADIRRYNLASRVIWVAAILIAAILVASIASMLFGTPEQSAVATALLKYSGTAAGGAGVGYAMLAAMQRLLRR